jgi:ABC-type transport system involved in multi-copper enzyme maturation permease subunit
MASNAYVLTRRYEEQLNSYQTAVQEHTDEIKNIEVYSELSLLHRPKVDKQPKLLSIFNQGVSGQLGNTVEVSYNLVPEKATEHGSDNPYLAIFLSIDLATVFQVVISLLALLFAYDTISGERESGTLRLALSNSVHRGVILLGKYLGGMLTLSLPLAASILGALVVIRSSPYAVLDVSDWARIGLFTFLSFLYVSLFFALGLLLSSCTHRAATTLMWTMFLWVVFVLIWPSATAFAVRKLVDIKSDAHLTSEGLDALFSSGANWSDPRVQEHKLIDLWSQHQKEAQSFLEKRGYKGVHEIVDMVKSGYSNIGGETLHLIVTGSPENVALFHEYMNFKEELRIDYADKLGQIWQDYLTNNPIRQALLVRNIARVSPAAAYDNATAVLSETDLDSHLRFIAQAKDYRRQIIQYLRDKKAFSSPKWYTTSEGKADASGIPIFHERREPLSDSLKRATVDILILALMNVVFFLGAYMAFLRYDVR